jgi:uncharacterized membrane protein YkvA (DUF1232 family)
MRNGIHARAARLGTVSAFFRYMRDGRAGLFGKLFVLFAAAYVVMPIDAIPDVAPIIGWLDDLGIATIALLYLSRTLAPYREVPQLA